MVLSRACFAEPDDAAERLEAADGAEDEEEDAIAVQQPHRKVEEKDIDAVIIEEEFFAGWSREEEEEYKQCVLPSQPIPRREMTAELRWCSGQVPAWAAAAGAGQVRRP